jgi:hypothetical protein
MCICAAWLEPGHARGSGRAIKLTFNHGVYAIGAAAAGQVEASVAESQPHPLILDMDLSGTRISHAWARHQPGHTARESVTSRAMSRGGRLESSGSGDGISVLV